jgi:hypothetical protein
VRSLKYSVPSFQLETRHLVSYKIDGGRAHGGRLQKPGQRQFGVDERGNVDMKLCAGFVRDEKAVEGHRSPRRWRVDR